MKRFIAILIAFTMLMGLTAGAESSGTLSFGGYNFDTAGSVEYDEPENGYSMIDYGDYVITIEYFELAANGFDQAYFDEHDENDGVADSWEIGSLLLSIKYDPTDEDCLYAWYEEEPIDKSFNVDAVLFNGALPEDFNSGLMAGIAFVADGNLLLFEVISFSDHSLAEMQALRSEYVQLLSYNGSPVAAAAEESEESAPAGNVLGNMSAFSTSGSSSDSSTPTNNLGSFGLPQNPAPASAYGNSGEESEDAETSEATENAADAASSILAGIGASMNGNSGAEETAEAEEAEATTANGILAGIGASLGGRSDTEDGASENASEDSSPADISGIIGANISAGIPADTAAAEGVEIGRYAYDVAGCEEYVLEAGELKVDYGDRVIYIEYGTFEEYGVSFAEIAEIGGVEVTAVEVARLFYDNSDYADESEGIYTGCSAYEFTDVGVYPEGVMFIGALTEEYGSGPIVGCILVTEDDIIMYECVTFSGADTEEDMLDFFYETLGKLSYDGAPVLQ